ncbi:fimbrial protein [Achromobacter marplatensis]|uniref:fimbrial protein n=1 Tax=Achromobacter marplatensis TaxID=470868 RepID=UPI0002F026B1|nr:fimbrial protein [Achromobacter marplatensis]
MRAVSLFRVSRTGAGVLALGGALLLGAMDAAAQVNPRWAKECKLLQIGDTGNGGATPWEKTGADTSTVNNVIARRSLSVTAKHTYWREAFAEEPRMIHGGRWKDVPPQFSALHLIPTNVKGLSIRISGTESPGAYVSAQKLDRYLKFYSAGLQAPSQNFGFYTGQSIVVEVVVTGPVEPGSHILNDLDPAWAGTKFEVVATQRSKIETPANGVFFDSDGSDGFGPDGGPQCRDVRAYTVKDILTSEGGGGGLPIEAKCTVDAKFQGAGFTLPMGQYSVGDFRSNGSLGKEVPFDVSVHTCAAGAKPKIAFNAQYGLISGVSNVLQLQDHAAGTSAKNLGIIITKQGSEQPLIIGQGGDVGQKYEFDNVPVSGVAANGTAEIKLGARYRRTDQDLQPGVKAGVANSQVNFKIYYD